MTWDLPDFVAAIADRPAPASGSAAAYAAAMAAALVEKVAARSGMDEVVPEARRLRSRAMELVDADRAAVEEMLAAGRPTRAATEVPARIGELAAEVLALASVDEAPAHLRADSLAARELSRAAAAIAEEIGRSNA